MESAAVTPADLKELDTFQLKGLRQILKLNTTYSGLVDTPQGPMPNIRRENTNKKVYDAANEAMKKDNPKAPQ